MKINNTGKNTIRDICTQNGQRNGFLDVIKFLATVLIIFHHYQQGIDVRFVWVNFWDGRFYFGRLVELFFMISGFLMYPYISKIKDGLQLKKYMTKRYLRLIPLVALSSVFDLIIKLFLNPDLLENHPVKIIFETITVALGFHGIVSTDITVANNPMWYISVLLWCYFIFYLSIFFGEKASHKFPVKHTIIFMVLMIFGFFILLFQMDFPFSNEYIGRGFFAFFCGVLISYLISGYSFSNKWIFPFFTTVLILSVANLYFFPSFSYVSVLIPYIVLFCYSSILILSKTSIITNFFNNTFCNKLAQISFHAFCLHIPVKSLMQLFLGNESFKAFVYSHGLISMILYLLIVFAMSFLSYQSIEKPLTRFFKSKS